MAAQATHCPADIRTAPSAPEGRGVERLPAMRTFGGCDETWGEVRGQDTVRVATVPGKAMNGC
ncbi:hypothetical protein GCM10009602_29540 [Nocardiopsis tropica]